MSDKMEASSTSSKDNSSTNDSNNNLDSTLSSNDEDQDETWSCNMCTFKNSPERFKCEICLFERLRSTRKPRGNMGQIAAQVVKQQEQIRQQTRVKQPKSRASTSEFQDELGSPEELDRNIIKYTPPTTSGTTGLIIDKKRFTQHSVTVNDITITFTEFATRQNTYIRKKKKRRN